MTKTKKPEPEDHDNTAPGPVVAAMRRRIDSIASRAPRRDLLAGYAKKPTEPKLWNNEAVAVRATIVTYTGQHVSGKVTCWIGPGECELDTGARGVLLETHQRRAAKAAQS